MKSYKFRLEPVLKLRRLKEENCRTELGKLMMELERIEEKISHDRREIDHYYEIQEGGLMGGMKAGEAQMFPMMVAGKDRNIQLLLESKARQEKLIEAKRQELTVMRGELKVMEKLKEKDHDVWRRFMNREIDQKVEEQTQIWINYQNKKGPL